MKKIINSYQGQKGYHCFACCPDNPIGLHLEFYEDGDDIITSWHPGENYQGWSHVLHGGIISTLMDEVAGWVVNRKLQTAGMTTKLCIKFRKPVMTTDTQITVKGHLTSHRQPLATIYLTLENSKGELCDEAEATYYTFSEEKAREMGFKGCYTEDENKKSHC